MIDPHSDDVTPDWPAGQEAEEERVNGMLDVAYHMTVHPDLYQIKDIANMLDDIYWVQHHGDFDWSNDLDERMTITTNVLEEIL